MYMRQDLIKSMDIETYSRFLLSDGNSQVIFRGMEVREAKEQSLEARSSSGKPLRSRHNQQKRSRVPSPAALISIGVHAAVIISVGTMTVRMAETPASVEIAAFLGERLQEAPRQAFNPVPDVTSFPAPQEAVDPALLAPPIQPITAPLPQAISTSSSILSASANALHQPQPVKPTASRKPGTSSSPTANAPEKAGRGSGEGADARPLASKNSPPRYPEMARRNGWQGVVLVRVTVLPDGRVRSASLFRGSGYAILDQSALDAVRRWLFQPKMTSGLAVESTIEVPVTFSLRKA
jgi:protein TonB